MEAFQRRETCALSGVAARPVGAAGAVSAFTSVLLALHDVLKRAEMFSRLHLRREPLSVRQRMSEILLRVKANTFSSFSDLFDPEEGRMGVAVTFIAILELLREAAIEVAQAEAFAPLHVRAASSVRLVSDDGVA